MNRHAEGAAVEKLSQGTIGARRLLQVVSLIGFLVAIVPLSTDSVSVFGIGFSIGEDVLKGMLMLVLIYLTAAFVVRVLTDVAAAGPSRLEVRLSERINGQTDDIGHGTMERLANLLPSGSGETFHSDSFASLLNDAVPKTPRYRVGMIKNTISDIGQWKSRKSWGTDGKGAVRKDAVEQEFEPVLEELLESHEASCKRRRLWNAPGWVLHRGLIMLRFTFFDALAPLLIGLLAIALLCGWMDGAWILDSLGVGTQ
ncbi:hypothetical protein [Candidatus Rariloculus sp.]|uniref:hypothetical protein n=1 Tax=Candidatus Rariloculus sp. TaxID=3101265 RepID=UPI003D0D6663